MEEVTLKLGEMVQTNTYKGIIFSGIISGGIVVITTVVAVGNGTYSYPIYLTQNTEAHLDKKNTISLKNVNENGKSITLQIYT